MKPQDLLGAGQNKEARSISRSLLLLVAAAVLPLLIFGAITVSLTLDQKRTAVADELGKVVRALRVAVDRELLGQFQAMDMLATDPSLDGADFAAFRQRARRALETRPEWRDVALIDPATRRPVASVVGFPAVAPSVMPDEVEQVALRRKATVAVIVPRDQTSGNPFVALFAPVVRDGQVRYVMAVAVDPRRMSDLFGEQRLEPTWTGAAIDGEKRIAGRSRDPERFLGAAATPSLAQRIASAEGGLFSALNQEGHAVYTMFSRSAATGWSVVIGVPTAEIDLPLRRFVIELLLLGGALLVFGLIQTYAVASIITRRSDQYERSMRDSQARLEALLREYNDLLERIPVGVYKYRMLNGGGHRFDFVSPRMCQQLGVSAEEIYRDPSMAFKCADEQALADLVRVNDEARATLKPFAWEGPMLGPHGKLWLRMESEPTLLPNGDVLWNGIQYDITERKRNAEQYRTIIQASLDGFWVTDLDGRILDANPAICRSHGYTRDELLSMRISDIEADESAAETAEHNRRIVGAGHAQFEARHRRKDGSILNVEVSVLYEAELGERFYAFVRNVSARKQAEQRLQESEAKFRSVFENSMDATLLTATDGAILAANPAAQQMLGYSEQELCRLNRTSVVDTNDPRLGEALEQRRREGKFRGEMVFIDKYGRHIPVEVSTAVFSDYGGLQLTSMSVRDISERKRTEQRLIESELRLQTIIELEPECIKIIDEEGRLRHMNPAGLAMIEADSLEQVVGQPVVNMITPPYREAYLDLHRRVIGGQGGRLEFEVVGLRGGKRWLETNAVPMRDHGVTMHLAVTRDVTERRKMEQQVRQMAFHDELTQLPNRRLLLDRLSQAMSASKRSGKYGAVMFLDLDNFKPINDEHGHEAGDLLLVEVARRLCECVRESDTVARFGGDEFVIVLNDLSPQQEEARTMAGTVADKVRTRLGEPYRLSLPHEAGATIEHHCAASIGVVLFLNHEAKADDILKWADATMYRAKEAGRDRVGFFA